MFYVVVCIMPGTRDIQLNDRKGEGRGEGRRGRGKKGINGKKTMEERLII